MVESERSDWIECLNREGWSILNEVFGNKDEKVFEVSVCFFFVVVFITDKIFFVVIFFLKIVVCTYIFYYKIFLIGKFWCSCLLLICVLLFFFWKNKFIFNNEIFFKRRLRNYIIFLDYVGDFIGVSVV